MKNSEKATTRKKKVRIEETNTHVTENNETDNDTEEENGPPPVPKKPDRKSFYDYSDYGALQKQLSLSEEETDFSDSNDN